MLAFGIRPQAAAAEALTDSQILRARLKSLFPNAIHF
jgi:hypothetical protein